ncbi:unnamed protein product, partial [Rotaria magnacalcarata]
MPMEHMKYNVLLKLMHSTRDIYDRGEKLLLEESLVSLLRDSQKIETSFGLLENIYKQEFNIFNDFYILSKVIVEERFCDIWNSIDLQSLAKQATEANTNWLNAGTRFVQIRQKKRTKDEAFLNKAKRKVVSFGRNVWSLFVSGSTDHAHNDIDHCFASVVHDILLFMQSQQRGIHRIFTMARQEELNKVIELHRKYQSVINILPLNEQLFPESESIFILRINRSDWRVQQTIVLFWDSDKEKDPCLILPVQLNSNLQQIYIVVKTHVTHLAVCTDYYSGNKMKWSTFVDNQIPYHIQNHIKLTCQPVYNKKCYTVNGVGSELNQEHVPWIGDLQKDLTELEHQLLSQYKLTKEHSEFLASSITRAIDKLTIHMKDILTIISYVKLNPNDLSSPTDIYKLFMQLPRIDNLKKALDLLEISEFTSISPVIQYVNDDDPAIDVDLQYVQTYSMQKAFYSSRQCLIDARAQIYHFMDNLHLNRAHMALTYAWASARLTHGSQYTQEEFSVMLKECAQLDQRPFTINNEEVVRHRIECQRVVKDAQQVYRTLKRSSNNWAEIKRLTSLSSLPIEDDLTVAFAR